MNPDKLLETLSKELSELIELAESEMMELESSGSKDLIHSLFRRIHTIKGNSGMAGLKNLENLSHSLETLLAKVRAEELKLNPELNQLIFDTIDKLKLMIFDLDNEKNYPIQNSLTILDQFLNQTKTKENAAEENIHLETAKAQNLFLWESEIHFSEENFPDLNALWTLLSKLEPEIQNRTTLWDKFSKFDPKRRDYNWSLSAIFLTQATPEDYCKAYSLKTVNTVIHYNPRPETTEKTAKESDSLKRELKINAHNMDEIIELAKEALITRNILAQKLKIEEESEEEFLFSKHTNLILQLHDKLVRTRLQKFSTIFPRLQRVVRDTSKVLNKGIDFELSGGEVELDGMVMESFTECLLHLIRNSIDHGIESESERLEAGKSGKGRININATLKSGNIYIEIEDDGKGLDFSRIKSKAVEKGMFTWQQIEEMNDLKVSEIIFLPGFSTSEKISGVSGRGVGMDVVLTNFKKYGGNVRVESIPLKGTKFIGVIPQIISSMPCVIINILKERFVILKKNIIEFCFFEKENLEIIENKKIYKLRGKIYPLIDLREILFPNIINEKPPMHVFLMEVSGRVFAFKFDDIVSFEDLVIKPVPEEIKDVKFFSGISFSGDGKILLLLEPEEIVKHYKLDNLEEKEEDRIVKNSKQTSYLIFESGQKKYMVDSKLITRVEKIVPKNFVKVLEKTMIKIDTELFTVLCIEECLKIGNLDKDSIQFALVFSFQGKSYSLVVQNIVDVVDEPLFHSNPEVARLGFSKYIVFEEEVVLYLDPTLLVQVVGEKNE